MGTEEIPHIDNVNDTLKVILEEMRTLNQTMKETKETMKRIETKLNK